MSTISSALSTDTLSFKGLTGPVDSVAEWRASVDHSLAFFEAHAKAGDTGAYFSDVDQAGRPQGRTIHVLALSRLVYALAVSSEWRPENLERARAAADFLTARMIARDATGPYFLASVDHEGGLPAEPQLHVWEQAYGLCGLVELQRRTGAPELRALVRELHAGFLRRFRLPGPVVRLCMDVELADGHQSGGGYASVVYPMTSYMINLHEGDPENRAACEPALADLLAQAETLWDESAGWVNEGFGTNERAVPGHSFQLGWLFLRAANWTFLPAERRTALRALGLRVIDRTIEQDAAWDAAHRGLYGSVALRGPQPAQRQKDWWQHCEALPALAHAWSITGNPAYRAQLQRSAQFYLGTFFDLKQGGEFFAVDDAGAPIPELGKGSKGKSSYHVAECAQFVLAGLGGAER